MMRRLARAMAAGVVALALSGAVPAHAGNLADLRATMSGPATAAVGQTVSYGVQVTNGGPDAATGIQFTATLTGPGVYTLAVPVPAPKCSIRGSTITCRLGGINIRGGSVVFDVGVTMTAAGTVVQSFSVTASQADPNPSDNTGTVTTTVT